MNMFDGNSNVDDASESSSSNTYDALDDDSDYVDESFSNSDEDEDEAQGMD